MYFYSFSWNAIFTTKFKGFTLYYTIIVKFEIN